MKGVYEGYKQHGNMFNVKVDGNLYGFGPKDPKELGLEEGDVVSFETTQRGRYTNADLKTVKIESKASENSSGNAANSGSNTGGTNISRNEYWDRKEQADKERQTVIEQQSSRNAAIEVVKLLVEQGAVTMGAKSKQYDTVLNLIDTVTQRFNADLEGVRQYGLTLPQQDAEAVSAESNNDELDQ